MLHERIFFLALMLLGGKFLQVARSVVITSGEPHVMEVVINYAADQNQTLQQPDAHTSL